MKLMQRTVSGVSAVGVSLMLAQTACAQSKADESHAGDVKSIASRRDGEQSPATIEDIVVTAQKSSQSLQKVAAAVTAIDGEALVKLGTSSLVQLTELVPSVKITPVRSQAFVFVRGVGQTLTTPNADPAVAVNINGVYVPSEMTASSFFDVDRIEVLPGPQGTLYGRNATGGVINLQTRKPGNSFGVDGFVELGNYGRIQALAGVDVPITDNLAIRMTGTTIRHDGYYDTGGDDQKTTAGRLTSVWKPTSRTTITGVVTYAHDGGVGAIPQNIPPVGGDYRHLAFDPNVLGYGIDMNSFQGNLDVAQELSPNFTLNYIGGYNDLDSHSRSTIWAGPPPALNVVDLKIHSMTQEARLNGTIGRATMIAGVYYFSNRANYVADAHPLPVLESINGPLVAREHGEAVYSQLTYALTPRLRLTGGLRYSWTSKTLSGTNTTISGSAAAVVVPYDGSQDLERLDWKAGVEIDLGKASLLYANVATGFTPGGMSTARVAGTNAQAAQFLPVYLTAYTAGTKNRFGSLTLNLEGFYYEYKNYQVSARNPVTGQNTVYNADRSRVYGFDATAHLRMTAADVLDLSVSRLHAEAVSLITPAGNFSGFALPYSPDWTINAAATHVWQLTNLGRIEATANVQYASGQWAIYTHPAGSYISAHTQTDLNLGYHLPGDRVTIAAWVRNLEDRTVLLSGLTGTIPGPSSLFLAAPRTFGGRVSFQF